MLSRFSRARFFATPQTVACQASLSMGFCRQEYWSGLPWPPPEDLPDPGFEPKSLMSPALAGEFSTTESSVSQWTLRPRGLQLARPPFPSSTPRAYSNSCPSSWWCHPAISSSVVPFSSAPNPSQHQSLFQWVSSSHQVAKVLEFQLQHQSFQWIFRTDFL